MADKLARGIWPALVTPFTDDGSALAPARVEPLVKHLIDAGSNGFFVCGGTGEGSAMSVPERKAMTEATIAAVAGAVPLIFQVGATSTANAAELAQHAAAAGADAVASVAPVDQPNDLQAAVAHYAAIGAATDLPFYVYWLAHTADKNVTAEQFLEAMQAVPNFSGLKFTDSNFYFFQRLVQLGGDRLNLISGPDEICLGGMVAGSDAAIGSTYNIMPKLFVEMRKHFEASDIQPAMALQARANEVISTLFHFDLLAGRQGNVDHARAARRPCPSSPHSVRRCGPRRAVPGSGRPRLRSGMRAIPLPDGDLCYAPDFLAPAEADQFMRQLLDGIEWQQHHVVIFGHQHPAPRLSAWHGSPEAHYAYSGLALEPRPWTTPLLDLKTRLEAAADYPFNSVLLNQYRDGRDSMGWHSDDEPELGTNPTIASLSLGGTRRFLLRHKRRDHPQSKSPSGTAHSSSCAAQPKPTGSTKSPRPDDRAPCASTSPSAASSLLDNLPPMRLNPLPLHCR